MQTAFGLVRENGINGLSARNVAQALRCSTQPIFSYYANMAELKADVFITANQYYSEYFNKVESDEKILMNVVMAYIDFALEEPNLFCLLFMSDVLSGKKLSEFVEDDCKEIIKSGIPPWIDRDFDVANRMFTDMWFYAHGIASMLVANQLSIKRNEIQAMVKNMWLLSMSNKKEEFDTQTQ
ncbi:MAG: hypothetical protein PHZ11_07540 [Desulfitobacteriaceae bacterium]|nr:hypothetical protein [Desulfitobacteriaceae bacterium]